MTKTFGSHHSAHVVDTLPLPCAAVPDTMPLARGEFLATGLAFFLYPHCEHICLNPNPTECLILIQPNVGACANLHVGLSSKNSGLGSFSQAFCH